MSKKTIWEYLKAKGFSDVACAAIMGNMEAESNCVSCRLQGDFSTDYQKSREYTAMVDRGDISRELFVYNGPGGGGYGLCQWTEASRKQKLLNYARMQGVSIADESMQVNFCIKELRDDFPDIWQTLTTSHDLLQCTQLVLNVYENPAIKNLGTRMDYAKQAEAYFGNNVPVTDDTVPDACPIDGVSLQKLSAFLLTPEFKAAFKMWEANT